MAKPTDLETESGDLATETGDLEVEDHASAASPRNIVLCGFMGAGKTTVARLLAEHHGFRAVDTDEIVIANAGCSIDEVFSRDGEETFRQFERRAIASLRSHHGRAIATGGGALLAPENRLLLEQIGFCVYLAASIETLRSRVVGTEEQRPLARNEEQFRELFLARQHLYLQCQAVVDTDGASADETMASVLSLYVAAGGLIPQQTP